MRPLTYRDAAGALNGELRGDDGVIENVSTDTRTLRAGDLFVALKGERFDAHAFLDGAVTGGAAALMVSRPVDCPLPQIVVADTRLAMGSLGRLWRERFDLPVIAVTGSNGKTTVKEMLAGILTPLGETLVTQGNLNNDIGVPLTLLRLRERHRYAVVELGANHAGEIRYLAGLARPHTALITNAGPAHLEGFGSLEGVAGAKSEIYEPLPPDGHAVVNADDRFAAFWRERSAHCHCVDFSLGGEAAVRGSWNRHTGSLTVRTAQGACDIALPLPGEHNARNALAAVASALTVGAGLEEIRRGLESMQPVAGRLVVRAGVDGLKIIDDTYNANPASLRAALEVVSSMPGEAWLVLGDMAELGAEGGRLHAEMGELARSTGVRRLFALGILTAEAVEAYGAGACWYETPGQLVTAVRQAAHSGVNVLVKGSRAMRMERIVAELLDEREAPARPPAAREH